jgi:hypothetical protein
MSKGYSSTVVGQNDAPWPTPYRSDTDSCADSEPRLSRGRVLALAPIVAGWFLDDDQTFGQSYRNVVRVYRDAAEYEPNLAAQYLSVLSAGASNASLNHPFVVANEHDVANLHRAVWLLMLEALARLLNYNVHGDWGDPPAGGTSQGRYDDPPSLLEEARFEAYNVDFNFHTIPNGYGSYAISTQDLPTPDLGIGEAPFPKKSGGLHRMDELPLTPDEIRDIARRLGRALLDRATLDDVGQHPYHRVVKRFYYDRGPHTHEYAIVIGDLLYPSDPAQPENKKHAALLAGRITDDDFADIHRGAWLFLAHRFSYLVGKNPFGSFGYVRYPTNSVDLPAEGCRRVFEVPNRDGQFKVNLDDIDPGDDDVD